MNKIQVKTHSKSEFINITPEVNKIVHRLGFKEGYVTYMCPIPQPPLPLMKMLTLPVPKDAQNELNKIVPWDDHYTHMEGMPPLISNLRLWVLLFISLSQMENWRWVPGRVFSL